MPPAAAKSSKRPASLPGGELFLAQLVAVGVPVLERSVGGGLAIEVVDAGVPLAHRKGTVVILVEAFEETAGENSSEVREQSPSASQSENRPISVRAVFHSS